MIIDVPEYIITVMENMACKDMTQVKSVQSIERAFALTEALAAHPEGCSIAFLSKQLELPKSTVHRLLGNLVGMGYAVQDELTARYKLTLKLFEISSQIINGMDIYSSAKPYLDKLANSTGELVHLVVRDKTDIVYIYKAGASSSIIHSCIGKRTPLYRTAVGKAILSTFSKEEVREIWHNTDIRRITQNTITDLDTLQAQLDEARIRGYAIDDEENELGVKCVGFAIPSINGKAEAAFSITGLAPYMTEERIEALAKMAGEAKAYML